MKDFVIYMSYTCYVSFLILIFLILFSSLLTSTIIYLGFAVKKKKKKENPVPATKRLGEARVIEQTRISEHILIIIEDE